MPRRKRLLTLEIYFIKKKAMKIESDGEDDAEEGKGSLPRSWVLGHKSELVRYIEIMPSATSYPSNLNLPNESLSLPLYLLQQRSLISSNFGISPLYHCNNRLVNFVCNNNNN